MPDPKMFSEQEVAAIIRRAVELTEEQGSQYQPGVTREELQRIAEDVGVPVEALERAILELGQSKEHTGPLQLAAEFERVVQGEMDPSDYDLIVEGLKPLQKGHNAGPSQVGRKLTMSAWNGVGQSTVEVTSREGRTRINVKSNALFQALMTLYPAFIGSVIAVGSLGERGIIGAGVMLAAGLMVVGTGMFSFLTRRGHTNSRQLADNLRDRVARAVERKDVQQPQATRVETETRLEERLGG